MAGNSETLKAAACPNCGDTLPHRALGLSVTTACQSCGAVIDTVSQRNTLLYVQENFGETSPDLVLGMRGHFEGHEWEIIGWQLRNEYGTSYHWEEYLLFNPRYGFRWLSLADGHWNWITSMQNRLHPTQLSSRNRFDWNGKSYALYHKSKATTLLVLGEFYWRLKEGYTVQAIDFIAPPDAISVEADGSEISCSHAQYLTPKEVQDIFGLEKNLPIPEGIAPNQPSPYPKFKAVLTALLLLAVGLTVFQFILSESAPEKEVLLGPVETVYSWHQSPEGYEIDLEALSEMYIAKNDRAGISGAANFMLNPDSILVEQSVFDQRLSGVHLKLPERTLGPFETHDVENLLIECRAGLSNQWMEVDYTLFNSETNEALYASSSAEYYEGNADGDHWSEGELDNDVKLSSLPAGKWMLTYGGVAGPANSIPFGFQVRVVSGISIWTNYFWAMGALLVFGIIILVIIHNFDRRRWSESDYSSYSS